MFSLDAMEKQLQSNIITGIDVGWPVWKVKELPFNEVLELVLKPALKVFFGKLYQPGSEKG